MTLRSRLAELAVETTREEDLNLALNVLSCTIDRLITEGTVLSLRRARQLERVSADLRAALTSPDDTAELEQALRGLVITSAPKAQRFAKSCCAECASLPSLSCFDGGSRAATPPQADTRDSQAFRTDVSKPSQR